ncbi:MAG: efflux transporter outer membrane subunit [bacterium]|nr:efflux transporter outer membrane subunit [bacterium]
MPRPRSTFVPIIRRSTQLSATALLIAISGCTVGPDYQSPEISTPAAFHAPGEKPEQATSAATNATASDVQLASWWTVMNDPMLSELVDRAISDNHDIRIARARTREARALRGATQSGLYPTVDVGAGASRSRASEKTDAGFFSGDSSDSTLFVTGLDASWELDVFGGVRRGIEAADADLAASIENERDVLVSLISETALSYTELRGLQRRLYVVNESVRAQRESVELIDSRFRAGLSSELQVSQALAQLAIRESLRPGLQAAVRAAIYRLSVLIGKHPAELVAQLDPPGPIPTGPSEIPLGLPSDLLRRRPDLRRAERQFAAATARIGVETADLYPRFSLTGSFGFEASEFPDQFDMNARSWSFGPAVRWRLFDRREIKHQIAAAGARADQAFLAYDQAVLVALEEVEDSVVLFHQTQARRKSLEGAVAASQRAVDLATDRFTAEIDDYLNVLDGQKTLYDAQDELAQSELASATAVVAVYKALGGGWTDDRIEEPAPAPAEPTPTQP